MAIIKRFTGGSTHEQSAMLTKALFETATLGETFTVQNIFSDCPINLPVFGDLTNDSNYKNDYLGVFDTFRRPYLGLAFFLLDENCNVLAELNNETYGTFFDSGAFENNSRSKGYQLEWKKVLSIHGPGIYKIKKVFQLGVVGFEDLETCSCNFDLQHYSDECADNTVKMEFVYDSCYINSQEDFRGENWKSMFRVFGNFGRPEPQFERSSYLNTSRQITDIQDKVFNEYTFETEFVPHCISELLLPTQENKSLASIADEIFITDYNLTNHFDYNQLPVYVTKVKPIHNSSSKKISYELTFEDRNRKNVKRKVK